MEKEKGKWSLRYRRPLSTKYEEHKETLGASTKKSAIREAKKLWKKIQKRDEEAFRVECLEPYDSPRVIYEIPLSTED